MLYRVSVALVISTYNRPEALKLVLQSILHQTALPDEVIIADDGSDESTRKLINLWRFKLKVPLKHFWQKDDGFRKTSILNQAIEHTSCDYIIQIDGDIIMHPNFIEDHMRVREKGCYIRGSRVQLNETISQHYIQSANPTLKFPFFSRNIKNKINMLRLPFLVVLFAKKSSRSDNVHGSNCAFWKGDFLRVNGYNNDMKGWGHEDIELAARFINAGLQQKKVKMVAVCYHLYHTYCNRQRSGYNYSIYEETVRSGRLTCKNGYEQIRKKVPAKIGLPV